MTFRCTFQDGECVTVEIADEDWARASLPARETMAQFAARWGLALREVKEMKKRREIPSLKFGRRVVIPSQSADAELERRHLVRAKGLEQPRGIFNSLGHRLEMEKHCMATMTRGDGKMNLTENAKKGAA